MKKLINSRAIHEPDIMRRSVWTYQIRNSRSSFNLIPHVADPRRVRPVPHPYPQLPLHHLIFAIPPPSSKVIHHLAKCLMFHAVRASL